MSKDDFTDIFFDVVWGTKEKEFRDFENKIVKTYLAVDRMPDEVFLNNCGDGSLESKSDLTRALVDNLECTYLVKIAEGMADKLKEEGVLDD